jgi:hypothetical protein
MRCKRDEIEKAMADMNESTPGEDGVRNNYIRMACDEVKDRVIVIVKEMVPLHIKGDRNNRYLQRSVSACDGEYNFSERDSEEISVVGRAHGCDR